MKADKKHNALEVIKKEQVNISVHDRGAIILLTPLRKSAGEYGAMLQMLT